MARMIITEESRSLREFRLLTRKTDLTNVMSKVSLKTRLAKLPNRKGFLELNLPFVSAAMQAVSGRRLAVALAEHGGISVLPCSIPIEEQVQMVRDIKRKKAGFQEDVITVSPNDPIERIIDIMNTKGYAYYPVTKDGSSQGKLIGYISEENFDAKEHKKNTVKKHMITDVKTAYEGITLREANKLMIKYGVSKLPIINRKGYLRYVVFRTDMKKHLTFPEESIDTKKRFMVGAAVSTRPDDKKRIDTLIEAGTDILFIDSSDGYSQFQADTLAYIRTKSKTIPVVGGNVITREGFMFLVKAGFNAIKVGMGIGSGCTTQQQKGTGRGQATALINVVKARDQYYKKTGTYIPIIADGGISNSSHIVIALAIGADNVMMGSYFAHFTESRGKIRNHPTMGPLKEYWMEASQRARNYGRYDSSADIFFEEGIEGFVPHKGSIYDNIPEAILKIKSALSNAGCKTIAELHTHAVLELQSIESLRDGNVHDIITN